MPGGYAGAWKTSRPTRKRVAFVFQPRRNKSQYESDAAIFVGKRIQRVLYYELQYDEDGPYYVNDSFSGHLLDFGCDLEMTDGSVFGIIWDSEYFQYGVGVTQGSLSVQLADARVWDVTQDRNWARLINQTITKVNVYWSWVQYIGSPEKHHYPQDVEVEFSDGSKVFFSASQYNQEKDTLWGMSDDIAVVFGNDAAKRYGIGPYAEPG